MFSMLNTTPPFGVAETLVVTGPPCVTNGDNIRNFTPEGSTLDSGTQVHLLFMGLILAHTRGKVNM